MTSAAPLYLDRQVGFPESEIMNRRTAMLLMGLGVWGGAASWAPAYAKPSRKPVQSRFLTLDPEQAFRAHFRFERDLRPQSEALTWYHFTVYAAEDGVAPRPIVRFEGMEYSYFREIAPLTWKIDAHNVSYPRDLTTGAFAESVLNPITKRQVAPKKMVLLDDPGVVYGPKGYLLANAETDGWLPSPLTFRISDEFVVVDHVRPKPESWPKTFMEASTSWVSKRDFDNPRVTSLMCGVSGFYTFPFPPWLEMGDRPGRMIGAWFGEKLPSVDFLPEDFATRVRREHPELLRPRLHLLDRPLSPLAQRLVAELQAP